ncbi:hypothetical protein [Zeimonas arvi]|uniref:hypothetical protein n=1 Tax=Zeimonas arvi TaxID=2498847 RepID=UPI001650822D|nr:hypothetical protein [Zeimonas arvi]
MKDSQLAQTAPSVWRRLFLLLACVAGGLVVGFAGLRATGSSAWFLAVPAFVAAGWLRVADPDQCAPCRGPEARRR